MKKYLKYAVAAFVIFYLLSAPKSAAGSVRDVLSGMESAGGSVATFLTEVSK